MRFFIYLKNKIKRTHHLEDNRGKRFQNQNEHAFLYIKIILRLLAIVKLCPRTAVGDLRSDFTSKLVHVLAFGTSRFYIAPYDKIKHELVNLSSNCDVKSGLSLSIISYCICSGQPMCMLILVRGHRFTFLKIYMTDKCTYSNQPTQTEVASPPATVSIKPIY